MPAYPSPALNGPGRCPRCPRPVLWTTTARNAVPQAVDPQPAPDGRVAVYQDGTGRWRSRQLSNERPTPEHAEQLFKAHAATCPNPAPRPGVPRRRNAPTRLVRRTPWRTP